mmetsp:Transcript_5462/g.8808  ORF Transcript_5462/g.8808 Transcript_5462/m.8808 type:complete len:171 (+) Transcript_5462:3-515(+)
MSLARRDSVEIHIEDDYDDQVVYDQAEMVNRRLIAQKREAEAEVRKLINDTLEEEGFNSLQDVMDELETLKCENKILRLKCGYEKEKYKCPQWHSQDKRILELLEEIESKKDKIVDLKLVYKEYRITAEKKESELNAEIQKLRMKNKELNMLLDEKEQPKSSYCSRCLVS